MSSTNYTINRDVNKLLVNFHFLPPHRKRYEFSLHFSNTVPANLSQETDRPLKLKPSLQFSRHNRGTWRYQTVTRPGEIKRALRVYPHGRS